MLFALTDCIISANPNIPDGNSYQTYGREQYHNFCIDQPVYNNDSSFRYSR
ncbi:MAG: hypothetical protein ACI9IL_001157 [Rickettsiales bacterium]|jgi:hypothetical protein